MGRRLRSVLSLLAIMAMGRMWIYLPGSIKYYTGPLTVHIRQLHVPSAVEKSFRLVSAGVCRKKDGSVAKYGKCGEDSFVVVDGRAVGKSLLAVADGVGGWGDHGGDSSQVSNGFMTAMKQFHRPDLPLRDLIKKSFEHLITLEQMKMGTTTICAAVFDHGTGELSVNNIGDSQLVVVRAGKVVLEVEAGVWAFNSPNQIGFGIYGEPQGDPDTMTIEKTIILKSGDIVILGTDGLFDNVPVPEIARLAGIREGEDGPAAAAKRLLGEAYRLGKDATYLSPFAKEAIAAGKAPSYYRGGKPDDISIIVAHVQ